MTFFIKTFGCQMNVNDSEKMRHLLEQSGLACVPDEASADIIIVNSCAVRQKSQEKVFSYIGRFPASKKIILAGCVAQAERETIFRRAAGVSAVVGTHQFHRIGEIAEHLIAGRPAEATVAFSREWRELIPGTKARESRVSGYVSIMEGCNRFCAYCIVPFTRGREKYRPFRDIVREAESLAKNRYAEVILLGQNVSNWRDRKEWMTFAGLLDYLANNVDVRWIRFVTSYPGSMDRNLIRAIARNSRIARHIHLPAQSGSTRILKKMLRNYTRSQYLDTVSRFKKEIPEMKFSSDFIVGFPSETDRDFRLTLSLLERVEYESVFSFLYSPRQNTPAAKLKDDLDPVIKKERLHRLQELQAEIQLRNNRNRIGTTLEVLITQRNPKKPNEAIGRTESYRVVNFETEREPGSLVRVRITKAGPYSLRGEEIEKGEAILGPASV